MVSYIGKKSMLDHTFLFFPDNSNSLRSSWQGLTTTGGCRYRQAIPKGRFGGMLDIDSNYGFRKAFLPQVYKLMTITFSCEAFVD